MKSILATALMFAFSGASIIAQNTQKASKVSNSSKKSENMFNTTNEKLSYALGIGLAGNLKNQGFDTLNAEMFARALSDVYSGSQTALTEEEANKILNEYVQNKQMEKSKAVIDEGAKFLQENGKKSDVKTTTSGLQYQVIKEGTGEKPSESSVVSVHYHGTLINGTVFDSSVERNEPAQFPVNGVIKGWVEALQLMNVGSKYKLFIPYNLAYGERAAGPKIPAYSTLIFEVELLSIVK